MHQESKDRYGAPRIHAELRHRGRRHGRKRIARLMRAAGVRGCAPKRWKKTTIPDPAAPTRTDLICRVVGFALADHLRTELAANALANAVAARNPEADVIFHSDRGCQYTSAELAHGPHGP